MPTLRLQTPKPKSQDAKAPKQQPQSPELQDPKAPASQHPTAPKLCVQTKSAILEEIVDPARRKTKISGHLLSFTLAYYAFLGCVPKVFDFHRSYTASKGSFRARCWESIWVRLRVHVSSKDRFAWPVKGCILGPFGFWNVKNADRQCHPLLFRVFGFQNSLRWGWDMQPIGKNALAFHGRVAVAQHHTVSSKHQPARTMPMKILWRLDPRRVQV